MHRACRWMSTLLVLSIIPCPCMQPSRHCWRAASPMKSSLSVMMGCGIAACIQGHFLLLRTRRVKHRCGHDLMQPQLPCPDWMCCSLLSVSRARIYIRNADRWPAIVISSRRVISLCAICRRLTSWRFGNRCCSGCAPYGRSCKWCSRSAPIVIAKRVSTAMLWGKPLCCWPLTNCVA